MPFNEVGGDTEVSILSQPEGRELLEHGDIEDTDTEFQSSPSPKAGSYLFRLKS